MQALEPQAGEALERMLARYARVRLDPSPAESRRARSAVMAEAWRRRLDLGDTAATDPSRRAVVGAGRRLDAGRRRGPFARWGARRVSAALAAAMLAGLLVGSTAFAASRAGGPLYETRLALEELVLPTDPASRVEAQIAWAQARVAEAVEASSRNDQGALSAALAAYERTTDTLGATTGDPAIRAHEAVAAHRAVLARVAATAPESAMAGLDQALAASDTAIDRLTATEAAEPGNGAAGGGAGGNGTGGSNGGGGAGNGGGGTRGGNGGSSGNAEREAETGTRQRERERGRERARSRGHAEARRDREAGPHSRPEAGPHSRAEAHEGPRRHPAQDAASRACVTRIPQALSTSPEHDIAGARYAPPMEMRVEGCD